ncbi:DNA internalization-related competence protein ComEC/Rec2 [Lapidilactobacillus luobeiensis]|uniref:DNA internalization-related competence protein ComEC/Rec2 n=1 Tax=Lapidilactobacillus luobeiensis TaxID=2950371 RepID=UPI0021C3AC74|nr:DNA internalization-related competence protein ComEC/Rec2 [Lapidilactobacillus luobeiensis]
MSETFDSFKGNWGLDQGVQGKLLWSAVSVALFLGVFWSQQPWLFLLLLGLALLRLIWRRQWSLLGVTCCCCGLFGGRQLWSKYQRQYLPTQLTQLSVGADQIKFNGDLLTGIARTEDGGRVFALITIPDNATKQALQRNCRPLLLTIKQSQCEKISPAPNQAQFDFANWASHREVTWQVKAQIAGWSTRSPQTIFEWLGYWRSRLCHRWDHYPRCCRFHLRALITGVQERVDQPLRDLLSTWGLVHLLALSGFHVSLIVKSSRWLGARLHCPDEIICGVLSLVLPGYAIFVGGQIGIWRAVVSFLLSRWQHWRHRHWSPLDRYALTLLICLFLQPAALFELGAQLSFGLTLLFYSAPPELAHWRLQLRLSALTGLILLGQTGVWSLWLLVGGSLAPIFALILLASIFSTGLCASSCAFWEPFWQRWYTLLSGLTDHHPGRLVIGKPLGSVILIALVLMLLQNEAPRLSAQFCGPLIILLCGHCLFIKVPLVQRVTLIDVGQGDSILVQTAWPRRTLLIDTGGRLTFPQAQWQARQTTAGVTQTTLPYLAAAGIDHLDHVLLTHQDADHVGDLVALAQQIPIDEIILPAGMSENPQVRAKLDRLARSTRIRPCLADQKLADGRLQGQFLAPTKPGAGTNEDSLVLLLQLGSSRWLFTGDLDQANELALLQRYPNLSADYLKIGHHGSQTASHPEFLRRLGLRGAFISAGRANRYHHPAVTTLTSLRNAKIPFLNTARYGMIEWSENLLTKHQKIRTKLTGSEGIRGQDGNENN